MNGNVFAVRCWICEGHIYDWVTRLFDSLEGWEMVKLQLEILHNVKGEFKVRLGRKMQNNLYNVLGAVPQKLDCVLSVFFTLFPKIFDELQNFKVLGKFSLDH